MLVSDVACRGEALQPVIDVNLVTFCRQSVLFSGLDDATANEVSRHRRDLKSVVVVTSMQELVLLA